MPSFRFIHAADLHLDTPFVGLGRASGALSARLRDASLEVLERIVAKAVAVEASFVIFAGDIYDGEERGVRAQLRFRDAVGRLAEAGIETFIVHGNHDPEGGRWTAVKAWPKGVHIMSATNPEAITVTRDGTPLATLHGISYAKRHTTENLALRFPVVTGGTHIAVLHCNVGDQPGHAPYSPCSLGDLRSRGMTYWALGHVHRHAVLDREPWVVYPGNTQGRSFAPGEQGEKGAVVVTVAGGQIQDCTFFATDSARFFEVQVPIDGLSDLGEVVDRLGTAGRALRERHPDVDLLLRATLSGRSELFRTLNDATEREEIRLSLEDISGVGVHWRALNSTCRPPVELDLIRAGSDLRAEVLSMADDWRGALPDDLRRELRTLGEPPSAKNIKGLIEGAMLDVIDRLSTGGE